MAHYMVIANGVLMGTYEGETTDEAIAAYVQDAGYGSIEEAAEVLSMTPDAWRAHVEVREATIEDVLREIAAYVREAARAMEAT